jgi:general secretion pathway protein D
MLSKPSNILVGLLLAGAVFAQEPVPPPQPTPPQNPPAGPAGPGAARLPVRDPEAGPMPKAPDPQTIKQAGYIEPKIDGQRLADLYSEITGRRVTVSNAALTAEFRFVQRGPITYGEAAGLLKEAALLEGFVFVPTGENHDRLIYSQSPTNATSQPLQTITDPADLPEGEQVVTYVMPLKYIKPQEMERTFTAVVRQLGSYGSIAAVPNASSIVITESSSLIRRLIQLQQEIDVPSQQVATRFIKVQYADVQELSETLNEILNTQQQQQRTAGTQRVSGGTTAPATPQGTPIINPGANAAAASAADGGGSAGEDIPIQIVPATRTNEIFAMGRPVDILFVETLVNGFDTPTDQKNFLRRKLKFLAVADFLPVAEQALQRAFSGAAASGTAGGGGGGAGATGSARGANFGSGGAGGGNSRTSGSGRSASGGSAGSSNGSFGGGGSSFGGGGAGGGGAGGGGGSLGEPEVNSAPESLLVGRTLLVADNITNSIVIQGPPASLEIVTKLLDEIDVKAEQVMISCVFGQLSLGKDLNYGVDYLRTVETRGDNVIGGRGGSGAGPLIPLDGSTFDPGDLAATAGLGIYGRIGPHMNVYLEALQSSNRFNVISRPTVFMANNQKGVIKSGQQIAVPTNSFNSGTTGQSTNIEYRDVVLSLEVIPLVNSADEVTLQIYLLNDEVLGSQFIESIGDVPTIATRELVTTVTVPNNETIVLGGLITTRDTKNKSGIPILSQIPWIGGLFGSTTNGKDREELLIFIQPKIVNDNATLYDAQADMDARYKIDDENRAFIQGPGVLPTKETVVETKGKNTVVTESTVVEETPGPRKASTRPKKGFVKNR